MRVLFNTYPVAFDCPGGGEIQLLKTKAALEGMGIQVALYDLWNPQFSTVDLVQYFSVQGGSMNFCSYVKKRGLPLLIAPILWLGKERDSYPLQEISDLLRICDLVLPNSAAEADLLAGFFNLPRDKFFVIHNGIDPSFAFPVSPALFREHAGIRGPFLLNVANVEPRKNQLTLVRALKGLDLDLVVLGNVRDAEYFEACRREAGGRLKYLGYLPHESELLKSAYRACDLFVLPSTLETPGLSALEAAACGARMVITEVGSTREYFGNQVTYVCPDDGAQIREGIHRELGMKRDDSLRNQVIAHFTWENTARQLRAAYEKVLGIS